jgi:hypothetical protein
MPMPTDFSLKMPIKSREHSRMGAFGVKFSRVMREIHAFQANGGGEKSKGLL